MSHPLINRPCRVTRPTFGDDYPAVICEVLTSGHLIVAREDGALALVHVENVTLTDTAHLARVLDPQNASLPRWVPAEDVAVGTRYFGKYTHSLGVTTDGVNATVTHRLKNWLPGQRLYLLIHACDLPEGT